MRALLKTEAGYNKMGLIDIPKPKPIDDQVLVKVIYTGICGTDIHTFKGEYNKVTIPLVLGHEFSGIVEEVGKLVTKVKPGDCVTGETTFNICGHCDYCKRKEYNLCPNRQGIGTQVNGSFADFVLCKQKHIHLLEDDVSLLEAVLAEPIACCVHASTEKVQVQKGDVVAVVGPGTIGLCLSQVLKDRGATVIVLGINRNWKKMKTALELGADFIINTQVEDPLLKIGSITDGEGVDYCFECSGSPSAVENVFKYIKKKGTLVQVGIFPKNNSFFDIDTIIQRELTLIGSRSQKPSSWDTALNLLGQKKIDADKIITKIFPLEDWKEAFEATFEGQDIKVVLQPNNELSSMS